MSSFPTTKIPRQPVDFHYDSYSLERRKEIVKIFARFSPEQIKAIEDWITDRDSATAFLNSGEDQ